MRGRLRAATTRRSAGAALAAAFAVASAGTWAAVGHGEGEESGSRSQPNIATATVTRRDLVARDTFEGSLGYTDVRSLTSSRSGTVTWLPPEGKTVRRGGLLYRVNGEPVVLLYGSYPLWRPLANGTEGPDVRQLEENLVALGYDPERDIEVDGEFDWATEAVVERWQEDLGVTEDGSVETAEAVFLPGARRVGALDTDVGLRLGAAAPVMETSSTRRIVTVELDARRQTLVRKGQSVEIELPNARTVRGRIAEIGKVANVPEGGDGSPTVAVMIQVANARATNDLDQAPVDVGIAREIRRDVLTVPVTALLALAGAGYAVELVEGGTTKLVRVEPGLFADGLVEITGDGIREGMKVTVPR